MYEEHLHLYKSLKKFKVKYLVAGGVAAAVYGLPRVTFDLDVWIRPDKENAQRLLDAMTDAGMGTASMTDAEKVLANEISVFQDRIRLDIFTFFKGVEFDVCWKRRFVRKLDGIPVFFIALDDLLAIKTAYGRPVDKADVEFFRKNRK